MSEAYVALKRYLQPLQDLFAEEDVNEISINRQKEVWIESKGSFRCEQVDELDYVHLMGLSKLVAQATEQNISQEKPLLSASISVENVNYRVQIIIPPASEVGKVIFSIRKPSSISLSLEDYDKTGAFDAVKEVELVSPEDIELKNLFDNKQIKEYLRKAIIYKKNMVISGGTSTGKTTFVTALLNEIPMEERLITIEDSRELNLLHKNKVHLLCSKGGQGRADVSAQSLLESCLRLRPDRIILGEVRGAEAFSFLRAVNTGHPGSITTVHADTPLMSVEQLSLMVMQADLGLETRQVRNYITGVVDIFVQLKRLSDGRRVISELVTAEKLREQLEI